MTYNVFGGTLSLTQSINQSLCSVEGFQLAEIFIKCCEWALFKRSTKAMGSRSYRVTVMEILFTL